MSHLTHQRLTAIFPPQLNFGSIIYFSKGILGNLDLTLTGINHGYGFVFLPKTMLDLLMVNW